MNVYWGGGMSGKTLLEFQHVYGNRSIAFCGQYVYRKKYGTCHLTGYKKHKKFWDVTMISEVHHKRIDEDNVRVSTRKLRKLQHILGGCDRGYNLRMVQIFPMHYIVPDINKPSPTPPSELTMGRKELKKYSNLKYADSIAYFSAINSQTNNNRTGVLEKMRPEYYPEVDTLIPMFLNCNPRGNDLPIDEWYKDKRNILPYKSDLREMVVKLLDGFADFRRDTKWKEDVIQAIKDDKKYVYQYLDDEVIHHHHKIARRLMKYGIDFEYFDLDKGSYKDTFGLDRSLDRNIDNPVLFQLKGADDKKKARTRYFQLVDLAEQYLQSRNIKDNRL
jgi:hypothetical protein|tara:strand:- start:2734 stop:3729 length:996 start_codon:yes stop_codon:yes gene_type:complete